MVSVHWLLRFLLDRLNNRGYDHLMSTVSVGVRNFLSEHNRDSMDTAIWRLPILEPRLLGVLWNCLRGTSASQTTSTAQKRLYLPEMD